MSRLSVVKNVSDFYSVFGQIVLLLLIQVGGLGVMAVATLVFLAMRKKISYGERLMMQHALSADTNEGVVRAMRRLVAVTFIIEGAGFIALLPEMIGAFGAGGIFRALFVSVSAFCNAGIQNLGGEGMPVFSKSVSVLLSISFCAVLGGLGFAAIVDILFKKFRYRKFSLHTRLVLTVTGLLLLFGTAVVLGCEYRNPATLGGMGFGGKLLNAFFLATNAQSTAGFDTVRIGDLTDASRFVLIFLSAVGASPGSTGGGIKTATLAILVICAFSGSGADGTVSYGKRKISRETILRAVGVACFSLALMFVGTLALLLTESGNTQIQSLYNLENILLETTSAWTTAGLSTGMTPYLSAGGKLLLIVLMFVGRMGPITLMMAFGRNANGNGPRIDYADAHILIG
ncbi:Trk family potassium uptake protein [Clostridia bacterium]|nr:Trk family potassium uptake protein [Clostridia bacterium]